MIFANVEIGIVAFGVGGLSGFLVLLCSAGREGVSQQLIAVVSSLMAIAIGKYFAAYYLIREVVGEEFGQHTASELSWYSVDLVALLLHNITVVLGFSDFIWAGLAVLTASTIASRFSYVKPSGAPLNDNKVANS